MSKPIPGTNPATYRNDPSKDLLQIKTADVSPDRLTGGHVEIKVVGTLSETISADSDAYVKVMLKYGLVRLVYDTRSLKDFMQQWGGSLPLEKGDVTLTLSKDLGQLPPGHYTAVAEAFTSDDRPIFGISVETAIKPPQ
ncbi:ML domain-containing protein [Kitasatospora sp. NPDC091257]|uniref:ML domain-containing protein n=1 Tax=Kitasatospora sp. NPDC091257 TaxID=3364084 RepID=UPI0038040B44